MWLERCAKKELQRFMRTEEIERNRNFRHTENHLYECLYDIICSDIPETDKFLELQRHKAKLVQLHAMRREKIMLERANMTGWMAKNYPSTTFSKRFDVATREQSYRFRTHSETS
jgi:hypothetical protein